LARQPTALFREAREVVLRKCAPNNEAHVRAIFEKEPFGELERLVTQTLLDVVKGVATEELENDVWLRLVAELSHRSYDIVLNPGVVSRNMKRFEFTERKSPEVFIEEPGLREFLEDSALSGTATEEEVAFLKRLRFKVSG
jgi:hypothetical protein